MKLIRWAFPIVIVVMAVFLWWIYTGMPQINLNHNAAPNPLQEKVAQLSYEQTQLAERLFQLQTKIDQEVQFFTMPEVYYYLNIANLHLSVFHDVKTALQLMQWVQQRLIISHAAMPLQEALSADIGALQTVSVPDIYHITQTLNGIELQIATLPVRKTQDSTPVAQTTDTTTTPWQQALNNAWGELKSLIRIQPRTTSMDYVLFDETILRETVRVELERASIAALIGRTDLYQASLEQAILALQRFFASDPNVQQAIEQLQNLTKQTLVPQIPQSDRALMWLQTQTGQGHSQ